MVVIDADTRTVQQRQQELQGRLADVGDRPRSDNEPIVIWIPKRHIETWVAYFSGEPANETDDYKQPMRDADYKSPAKRFVRLYQTPADRPDDLLPSISAALRELSRLPD